MQLSGIKVPSSRVTKEATFLADSIVVMCSQQLVDIFN